MTLLRTRALSPLAKRSAAQVCALFSFVLFLACSSVFGQGSGTGALAGTITDATGGAISGASVQLTSKTTGEVRTVSTASIGSYSLPSLPPGAYSVSVSKDGFKTLTISQVEITIAETAGLNLRMEVGAKNETVTVEATAEELQTESSTLGRVTSGEQVRTLPLVSRNYTQIISLNPGVAADVTDAGALGRGAMGNGGAPIVSNGGTINDNNIQMNGAAINDLQSSGTFSGGVAIPNPDTIQEFKVQTGQYDASYGRNAGANVDLVTKGGGNEFHGAAWEFLRNDALNANTFFRNATGQPKPVLKQNQFGFDFGGPIRKDKLFFFTSYQGTRQRNGIDVNCSSSINTPALTDDRSAAALGTLFAGQRGVFQNAFGGVGPAIAADGSNISPVALALLQLKLPNGQFVIPTPQTVSTDLKQAFDSRGFSAFSTSCPYTEDQFMTNSDWQMNEKSKLAARFFFANTDTIYSLPQANFGGGTAPGFPVALKNNFRNFTLTHSYIFSPSLVNQAVLGFHRTFAVFDQSKVFNYSQIGATVPGFDNTIPEIAIDFPATSGLTLGGNGQTIQIAQNNYNFQDSLSWTHGRHSFRFGGGIAREQLNNIGFHYVGGEIFLSWPDFLLGLDGPSNGTGVISNVFGSIDLPGVFDRAYRVWEGNAYVQDDIKLTPRLTVNLGLRYDRLGDLADTKGRNASFDASLADKNPPLAGTLAGTTVPSNYSGGAIPAGVTQLNNAFGMDGDGQNTWNPRVGFAWRIPHSERYVLRGGYGVYHSRYTGQPFIQLLTAPPFAQIRQLVGPDNAAASNQVPFALDVPSFPSFVPYSPTTHNTITVFDPHFRPPLTHEYSLGLQTEIGNGLILETSFSGARGLHLIRERSINQAGLASASNPIRGQTTNTVANIPLRVPFEGWNSANMLQIESSGASWYNALLVSLLKRFSNGLQFQASYTFAKDLATDSTTSTGPNGGVAFGDQNSAAQRYGPDLFIRKHRFIVNYSYEFRTPFKEHAFARTALGGWSIAGVTTVQSGRHLTVTFTNGASVFGTTNDRASLSGTCQPGHYTTGGGVSSHLGNYVNGTCFAAPPIVGNEEPPGTCVPTQTLPDGNCPAVATGFGNSGVGILDGPGQNNWDIALLKKFKLGWPREGAGLEFRTEFFNTFNHSQFGDPDTTLGSPTFGQITTTIVSPRVLQFALKLSF
ncbi:MAG TPA: carboxypeptidase regulatory-like domain-containing protein [Candidatus Dormibacteraeota bacterium]|nr:carboxypeptidase regulatory-like domain-containing protein [Candidatus Dormibacteraeota bacterium]